MSSNSRFKRIVKLEQAINMFSVHLNQLPVCEVIGVQSQGSPIEILNFAGILQEPPLCSLNISGQNLKINYRWSGSKGFLVRFGSPFDERNTYLNLKWTYYYV